MNTGMILNWMKGFSRIKTPEGKDLSVILKRTRMASLLLSCKWTRVFGASWSGLSCLWLDCYVAGWWFSSAFVGTAVRSKRSGAMTFQRRNPKVRIRRKVKGAAKVDTWCHTMTSAHLYSASIAFVRITQKDVQLIDQRLNPIITGW